MPSGRVKRHKKPGWRGVRVFHLDTLQCVPKERGSAELGKGVGSDASPWVIGREGAGAGGLGSLGEGRRRTGHFQLGWS